MPIGDAKFFIYNAVCAAQNFVVKIVGALERYSTILFKIITDTTPLIYYIYLYNPILFCV